MDHTSGRTHILGHICCYPFQQPDNTLPDHQFWVEVLDTLYLVVPLFEGHLHLSWHGIATESIYSKSIQLQPSR